MASHGDFLVVLVGTAHAWCAWRCSAAAAAVHAMAQEKRKREREKHDRQLADSDRFDVTCSELCEAQCFLHGESPPSCIYVQHL
jgi:hypothetical protein